MTAPGGIELRCVVDSENVEGRCCTGGINAVGDAINQLNGAVVIGIGREGITVGGITINGACISGVDGQTSDGERITIAIREAVQKLIFCKDELRILLDVGQGDGLSIHGLDGERRGGKGVAAIRVSDDVVESDFAIEVSIGEKL